MRQKNASRQWLFFVVLCLVMQVGANYPGYKLEFQEDHFLLEGIFQVQALDSGTDAPEFLVSGKNYTGREIHVYLLSAGLDFKPVIKWQSANLFEDRSILGVAVGNFSGKEKQMLAMSNTKLFLYQFEKEKPLLAFQGEHELHPLNISCGDLNGDGKDELIVAVIGVVSNTSYNCRVQVWGFTDNKFEMLTQSGLLGNIRSLTAGDLDGDGKSEVVVEEGLRTDPGSIHVLKLTDDNQLSEKYCLKKATKSAAYGMKIRIFPAGVRLIAATANGKIDFFAWNKQQLMPSGTELSFSSGLVDVDTLDLNGDKLPELLIACYPQRFLILSNQGGMN